MRVSKWRNHFLVCIHIVFSTKDRRSFLTDEIRERFHAYLAAISGNLHCTLVEINSVEDHVHVLVDVHRTMAVSQLVEELKGSSSKWMKTVSKDFSTFSWQGGYGAFAVSESNIGSVRQYIQNQREHHRGRSFEDELRQILMEEGIEFDEKYLFS